MATPALIRVGVLTSSRADYGIYLPLLRKLKSDTDFELTLIAFGTHLSYQFGYTLNSIIEDGFEVKHTISSMVAGDDPNAIATSVALTSMKFAEFWKDHGNDFDIIFCLGDRYEMFAAVTSAIPFNIKFAHLHGGETTDGAIDEIYRHGITLASTLHFTSTEIYAQRVASLIDTKDGITPTGALSLDNIKGFQALTQQQFLEKWHIDLGRPFVLVTIHPETKHFENNSLYIDETKRVLAELILRYQLVVTLPNADTQGNLWRNLFLQFKQQHPDRVVCVENFGTQSYFTCMQYCQFLLGNTSSGIIEAASFRKHVVDLGDRQKGRIVSDNVIKASFKYIEIMTAIRAVETKGEYTGTNKYDVGGAVSIIVKILKDYHASI
jgi:GDP/UDP-N,N'-diacetylbacillosamine 2-epimerase (hydrolysing)